MSNSWKMALEERKKFKLECFSEAHSRDKETQNFI